MKYVISLTPPEFNKVKAGLYCRANEYAQRMENEEDDEKYQRMNKIRSEYLDLLKKLQNYV